MAARVKREMGLRTPGNLRIVGVCFERGVHIVLPGISYGRGKQCFLPVLDVEGEGPDWEEGSKMRLGACSAGDDCGTKPYRGQWEVPSRGGPLGVIRKPENGWIKSLKEIGDCASMSEKQEEREAR